MGFKINSNINQEHLHQKLKKHANEPYETIKDCRRFVSHIHDYLVIAKYGKSATHNPHDSYNKYNFSNDKVMDVANYYKKVVRCNRYSLEKKLQLINNCFKKLMENP